MGDGVSGSGGAVFLLPLREKVARPQAVPDEGEPQSRESKTPHPPPLRFGTFSRKGRREQLTLRP
jgi:hypothetical protein